MVKKYALLVLSVALLVVAVKFAVAAPNDSVTVYSQDNCVVEKDRGDAFMFTITFQNSGNSQGSGTVNVVFEGSSWPWKGTKKSLTLDGN